MGGYNAGNGGVDGDYGGYSNPMNQTARLRGRAIFRFESVRSA